MIIFLISTVSAEENVTLDALEPIYKVQKIDNYSNLTN